MDAKRPLQRSFQTFFSLSSPALTLGSRGVAPEVAARMMSSSSASACHNESARCSERRETGGEGGVEVEVEAVEGGEGMDWRKVMRDSLGIEG